MSYIGKNPKVDSVKLDGSATVPTGAAVEGQIYFNTGTGAISEGLKVYKNAQFVSIDKQLGDADTIELLKASDVGGLQWKVAINSTSTTVGMNSPVPQYNATATGFANASSTFANSSTGNALLTNESADIVFAYESHTVNSKNDYFGIQVDVPRAFRGQNLVLSFEYRTAEASGASSDNDFLVSIQDGSTGNYAQTTNSTTTGSQAAGTSVAVASSTGFAVGDRVRVESGTAASGNSANSFTEAYVTAIADSTHLTFSETIVFPASGTTGIIASGWLTDQVPGQLKEADSDTNKVGKVYSIQFKTEEDTDKLNITFMNQSTTAAGIDIFIDNILLSANKFLQASSQTKSADYNIAQITSAMSDIQGGIAWNLSTATIADGAGFSDLIQVSTGGTGTGIYTKWEALVDCVVDAEVTLVDGGTSCAAAVVKGAVGNQPLVMGTGPVGNSHKVAAGCSLVLKKGEEFHFELRTSNEGLDPGDPGAMYSGTTACYAQIVATPEVSDVIILESQDEIFTSWTDYSSELSTTGPANETNTGTDGTYGTITCNKAMWRRVGDTMEIQYNFEQSTLGTASTGEVTIPLPSGYNIDRAKVVYGATAFAQVGYGKWSNHADGKSSATLPLLAVATNSATKETCVAWMNNEGSGGNVRSNLTVGSASAGNTFNNCFQLWATFKVPIRGWNANFNPLLSMPLIDFGTFENIYSARIEGTSTTATITTQSQTFIDTVSRTAQGKYTVTFKSGFFPVAPAVQVNVIAPTGNNIEISEIEEVTTAKVDIELWRDDAGATVNNPWDGPFFIMVQRQGSDYRQPPQPTAAVIKPAVAIVQNLKSEGTGGGTNATGTWTPSILNTFKGETWFVTPGTGTLGADGNNTTFTLEAGQYSISSVTNFYDTGDARTRLYDITNSKTIAISNNIYLEPSEVAMGEVFIEGVFTLTSSTSLRIDYFTDVAKTSVGLGSATSSGIEELYGILRIEKLK